MIDKIYDINGVAHKVQAAGTVYNEELNSLALGKGTSAIGQDQLVFGRNNIPDANKAEIVGGGIAATWKDLLIGLPDGGSVVINNPHEKFTLAEHYAGEYSGDVVFKKLCTGTEDDVISCLSQAKGKPCYKGSGGFAWKNDGGTVLYTPEFDRYYIILNQENPVVKEQYSGHLWVIEFTPRLGGDKYEISYNSAINRQNALNDSTKSNIRTLDWEGNETLAGGLSIGGSLKVGNTILTEAQLTALLALIPSNS